MNVNLGPVFDQFVADLLKGGLYQSQSEVLREALRLLKERQELKQVRLGELRKQIAIGSKQADRGEFVDGEKTFREIRKRSAERHRVPMMSISRSDLMPIRSERSDAGLSQCESVIDIRQGFDWFSLLATTRFPGADGRSP